MTDPLLTVPEVADALRLGDRAVYDMIRAGDLPAIRINGRTLRVKTSELNAYIFARGTAICK